MGLFKQLLIIAALGGLGYLGYFHGWPALGSTDNRHPAEETRRERQPTQVVVEPIEVHRERVQIEAIGTAEAARSATLYAASAGQVVAVNIEPDRRVTKGHALLVLDRRAEALAVELATARAEEARRLLERYESTVGSGAVPRATIDEARAALTEAQIVRREADLAYAKRTVVAPFEGHVGMTDVAVGDRIGPDDPITTIDDRSALVISFSVPEIFLDRLGVDHPIKVATWADREREMSGKIVDIGSRVDPENRSFTVRAHLANPEDRFRPGMSFAVAIELLGSAYPLVPEVAVQWDGDGAYFWVVRSGRAMRVSVRIVQRQSGSVLVDAAVEAGELIVVEGVQRKRSELEISPGGSAAARR